VLTVCHFALITT